MRSAARIDDNQREIVKAFRKAGASVKLVHQIPGFVDILVGYASIDQQVEIKDGSKSPSKRKLTEDEQEHWDTWKGRRPVIVESIDDVPGVLRNMRNAATRIPELFQ